MRLFPLLCVATAAAALACGPVNSADPLDSLLDIARRTTAQDPDHGGQAAEIHVTGVWWGRLVDVYGTQPETGERSLIAHEFVVGPDVASDGRDFDLETDAITSITSVRVLPPIGTGAFDAAWARLDAGIVPVEDKGLDPAELPPFPKVPRDAAIVVRFDDRIDPATVGSGSVQLWTSDARVRHVPARVFCDAGRPTRVILDTTTSEAEALASTTPVEIHPEGLPANRARTPNVIVRIPTQGEAVVRNPAGRGLAESGSGSIDASSPTRDVVRVFSSGAEEDPFHGLLADLQRPRVVGVQDVQVDGLAADPQGGPQDYLALVTFATPACARAAKARDVLTTLGAMTIVTRDSGPPNGARLGRLHVRLVAGGPPTTGPGVLREQFDPALDQGHEACFVRFIPAPTAPPVHGVQPASQLIVEFSEPMDASSVSGLEAWTVTSVPHPSSPTEYASATTQPSVLGSRFVLTPVLPLDHVQGTSETRYMNLASGPSGPRDPAGNPLRDALPQIAFDLAPTAPTLRTGSYVLRFQDADEDGNGHPEIRGQFLHDLAEGTIRPRPVSRFSLVADRTEPVPALMSPLPSGVQVPLTGFGAKLHSLWRYCDVGAQLLDESLTNIDVEGLDWSPAGGNVLAEHFDRFEMSLAHSGRLPDEIVSPTTLLPVYPQSGLVATYADNQLDPVHDPLGVVHPRALGYTIDPADLFVSSTGTRMMPWPLNRHLPPNQHRFYTWRDTSIQATGADAGGGAELGIVVAATGLGTPGVPYPAGHVPTIGLPLLMEFKCFPDGHSVGLNALDASIAVNSTSVPNFRAFSAGGINSSGQQVFVDPDAELVASGGFNPNSVPPGQHTLGVENTFYIGQMDLVVRVSRLHSVWIDTSSSNSAYAPPVVEPAAADQPAGTQVVLAFRGATFASASVQSDASLLDAYGEAAAPGSVTFFHGDDTWKSSLAAIDGARFVQLRATFVSNAESGRAPSISALGLAFQNP
ncbi:MAG TPA: Ig-like domain-containing protein [Planctomycetota bacterium]|jgi:hypothetical protein|nr:Ig-like domain-containing protein [Planctomycetota bacterium]